MSNRNESNPAEVAEYAIANKVVEEPAFIWWDKKVLRKCDWMIAKVKSHYWNTLISLVC